MQLTDVETDRELEVRRYPCPSCGALPWPARAEDAGPYACRGGLNKSGQRVHHYASHTARYNLAAAAGVVPPLVGSDA